MTLPFQVEFDSPMELLKIDGGKLRALVDQSSDKDALYTMAGLWYLIQRCICGDTDAFLRRILDSRSI